MDNTATHTTTKKCDIATQCEILKVSWLRKLMNATKRKARMILKQQKVRNVTNMKECNQPPNHQSPVIENIKNLNTIPEFPQGLLDLKLVSPANKIIKTTYYPQNVVARSIFKNKDEFLNEIQQFQFTKLKSVSIVKKRSFLKSNEEFGALRKRLQTIRTRACTNDSCASQSSDWN
eukprot:NODE_97_length_20652_cov_0.832093.p13 type:complete len:176 gc:universal NODE_97_length_20652_cov_0.832093:9426-8899(-)